MREHAATIINYYPADFGKLQTMDRRSTGLRKVQLNNAEDDDGRFVGMTGGDNFGKGIGGSFKKLTLNDLKAPSVTSASGKGAAELLREKLFNPKSYTTTEVLSLLESSGKGVDQTTSITIAKNVTKNIQAISMVIPTTSKITEQEQGRYVIDVLANMCSQGGELLIGVVSSNFDITEYTNSVREHVYELEQMKEENTLNLCELLPVDMKLHGLEKEDQLAT